MEEISTAKELRHPCFDNRLHIKYGRIHLPVAPKCNIQCRYCDRRYDCANESRPGVTSKVIRPQEAAKQVRRAIIKEPRITVAGIAGPGEPLYNEETLETFRILKREFPELILCVSTNGLLLEEKLPELLEYGIRTVTITMNTLRCEGVRQIYSRIPVPPEEFLERQQAGLSRCAECKMIVKVNTVCIPQINDTEIVKIAQLAANAGAAVMNLMPLIPQAEFAQIKAPDAKQLCSLRAQAAPILTQFSHCRQCRADAAGML